MSKTQTADAANVAVSNEQPADNQALEGRNQAQVARVGLSDGMRDKLSLDLQKTLAQLEMGIGDTSASKVAQLKQPFYVIDGVLIDEFEDRKTGEIQSKSVFRLEFADGVVRTIMQNAARPRRLLADACDQARALGMRFRSGPYLFTAKSVGGPSDALIMTPQPGFTQQIY